MNTCLKTVEFSTPEELDFILRQRVNEWRSKRGKSYLKLADQMYRFAKDQYLTELGVTELSEQEAHHLNLHCPKKSWLSAYVNGGAMCFRYINTIANFFEVSYTVSNFNPAEDFKIKQKLESS